MLYHIAKIPWMITIVNMITYWLHYFDLKYIISFMDLPPWQKYNTFISYEPGGRIYYKHGLKDEINKNIVYIDTKVVRYSHFYLYLFLFIVLVLNRKRILSLFKKLNR